MNITENAKDVFATLNKINVNEHTEKKMNLTYLSWAWAWTEVKKNYPLATYTIYENSQGWNFFSDGRSAWVKTGVTIEGLEYIEFLPVMNNRNQSIPLEQITSTDVNKAIQRSLTKACARHGLGLYIYAGEDLPESTDSQTAPVASQPVQHLQPEPKPAQVAQPEPKPAQVAQPTQAPQAQKLMQSAPQPQMAPRQSVQPEKPVRQSKWNTVKTF
jgi:hypothetical protein